MMLKPRTVGAAEFKAQCLELMAEVERSGGEIIITRHRKPVARLMPIRSTAPRVFGALAGMVIAEKDLVSPIDVEWTSDEPNFT
ncbi:MAG: type II toxin-antitoxin system Phd/YefM family antitoxin [Candidatus Eremiobacteraeota bacterium]|nr:type II toxin-antitoxin system Phd/YefM family antitoxin [Candidatus Eremiobacteraeota bacterium]MBV9055445.1 type II toxin-antitoxin system Phd/YefM family antitoxin [Candidatus Eremiobacteraeota bacterium]MBV9699794.1 type II toxin-antitoxin system Phd/YefM family antitoxin [Candidatus Eremiobacteraeota bacterium]